VRDNELTEQNRAQSSSGWLFSEVHSSQSCLDWSQFC
jgi:hypothetical protein